MSINKYQSHIFVLCEDSANRKIATGFLLKVNQRVIQILDLADGWKKAINKFNDDYAPGMYQYPKRIMILIIDFDERENRFNYVEERIPNDLKDRVFIIGARNEPEKLKSFTGLSFEKIGEKLAQDCADNTNNLWRHEELKHNVSELERMREIIKQFLFI
jgi:hypothetical protein